MSENGQGYGKIVNNNYVLGYSAKSYIIRTNSLIIERAQGGLIC